MSDGQTAPGAQPYGSAPPPSGHGQTPYGQAPPPPGYGQAPPPGYGQAPPGYGPQAPFGQTPPPPGYGQAPYPGYPGYPGAAAYAAAGYAAPSYGYGYELAHWGLRVGALLIDGLVHGAVLFVTIPIALAMIFAGDNGDEGPIMGAIVVYVLGFLATLGLWIWNRGVKQGTTGQSIGKKALGIRLISEATGQPVGTGMALVRDIAHVVDGFFYLGYLWPLWDEKKQTFSDKIVGTLVVRG
jgi:uncharacterized RDD family membrane protein YckC